MDHFKEFRRNWDRRKAKKKEATEKQRTINKKRRRIEDLRMAECLDEMDEVYYKKE